ncbi:MAG: SPOR domain-containing protein [Candidatus Omnitrophica bacterium]|nr:SPOR domain-containing protein [Candidatus Omnitrophota bacterium]
MKILKSKTLIAAAVFALFLPFLIAGCASYSTQISAKESLDNITILYLKGNYDEVIRSGRMLNLSSSQPEVVKALYYVGVSLLVEKRFIEARRYLEAVEKNDKGKELAASAALRFADSYYLEGKSKQAFQLYESFTRAYPSSSLLPSAYKKLFEVCQAVGDFKQADQYRETLLSQYPSSIEAQQLGGKEEKPDYFTIQVGAFFDENNARRLKLELEVLGYKPAIIKAREEKTVLYKVRLGQFKTRAEAAYVAGQLEARGYPARVCP